MRLYVCLLVIIAMTGICHAESPLESAVLKAVCEAHFENVIDFGAGNESEPVRAHLNIPAARIAHTPNFNIAVLQFDASGKLADRAFVLLSRDYPKGLIVPLDENLGAGSVRFLRWDIDRFNGGTYSSKDGQALSHKGWTNEPPLSSNDDILPGREGAVVQFMAPYPASLFKLMVAFHVMRMIDAGKITLETEYTYAPPDVNPETRKMLAWMDPMITLSDNHCTSALLKMLHDKNEIQSLNQEFRDLNLGTLQINGTNPKDGLTWSPGQIHMTAWDVARLLWLIDGGAGPLWPGVDGKRLQRGYLSDSSRAFLKKTLLDQAFNECLSTANFPGAPNVRSGIPSLAAQRWINPANGHVFIEDSDFGVDIRESNKSAEVTFAHKTGLTFNYASDAGIVTSIRGKPFRHYIIAFIANLGYRYADEPFAHRKTFPAMDKLSPICYTQRIPALGKTIDEAVTRLSARQ